MVSKYTNPKVLTNPKTKEMILNDIASKRVSDVAEKYNVTPGRISQIKKENQAIIEQKKEELLATVPTVTEIVTSDLALNKKVSQTLTDKLDDLDHSQQIQLKGQLDKTVVNVLKIASIYPTHNMQFIKNQVNIQDNSTTISPEFQEYMDMKSKSRQVIDIATDTASEDRQ